MLTDDQLAQFHPYTHSVHAFLADVSVLTLRKNGDIRDVRIAGWIDRDAFNRKAVRTLYHYGPKLEVQQRDLFPHLWRNGYRTRLLTAEFQVRILVDAPRRCGRMAKASVRKTDMCWFDSDQRLDRDVAQLGRARGWGSRGRRFESCHPDEPVPHQ